MAVKIFLLISFVTFVNCHITASGDCPLKEVKKDFDIEKFLGDWYVIQKIDSRSHCQWLRFEKDDHHGYSVVEGRKPYALDAVGIETYFNHTASLDIPDPGNRAAMRAKFRLNVGGKMDYRVLDTDYTNFAVIYECQNLLFVHRYSASILVRDLRINNDEFLLKARNILKKLGVSIRDLDTVRHSHCDSDNYLLRVNTDPMSLGVNNHKISKFVVKIGTAVSSATHSLESRLLKTFNDLYSLFIKPNTDDMNGTNNLNVAILPNSSIIKNVDFILEDEKTNEII